MKKLIYTFAFLLFTISFTACTTQDPLEDISIEIPEGEIEKTTSTKQEKTPPKKKIDDESESPF